MLLDRRDAARGVGVAHVPHGGCLVKHQANQHDQQDGSIDLEEQCRQQRQADQGELQQMKQAFGDTAGTLDARRTVAKVIGQAGQQPDRYDGVHQEVLEQDLCRRHVAVVTTLRRTLCGGSPSATNQPCSKRAGRRRR
jgi:hypothetical protein